MRAQIDPFAVIVLTFLGMERDWAQSVGASIGAVVGADLPLSRSDPPGIYPSSFLDCLLARLPHRPSDGWI